MGIFAPAMTAVLLLSFLTAGTPLVDSLFQLPQVSITALKEQVPEERIAGAVSTIRQESIKREGIYRPNSLSQKIPGLHIPDYGASLTSTVYMRGLGSRMENPVMGLYIDGIPVLDKNMYDFDWEGISKVSMLRGPQGTLYGRNSMGGVLSLVTLSPATDAAPTFNLEYGTANTVRAGAAFIIGSNALSATYRHTDGYFLNTFKNSNCDPYNGLSLRWKWERHSGDRLIMSNLLMANVSREGGFAYGQWIDETQYPVSYNDESGYSRLSLIDGYTLKYNGKSITTQAAASFQILADDMHMDQDYTSRSVFTLQQRQNSGAATVELSMRKSDTRSVWQPQTGVFSFFKRNHLDAPVTFKRDGIESLILDNTNSHIPTSMGYLAISDMEMPVNSCFFIDTWNAAVYHESVFDIERWRLTAGIRLDYEGGRMDYDCLARLNYRFVPNMSGYKELSVPYTGTVSHSCLEVIPKLSVLFKATDRITLYATLSKGYRAGGFNTQIFSDILQNRTMNAVMSDLGVYLDRPSVSVLAQNTEYDPETAWNMELGTRIRKGTFNAAFALYRIDVQNQQLTVFPPGMTTGRMMTNAGRSRSLGAETEVGWNRDGFRLQFAWSWCDARFVWFNDGNNDYSGNRIPYIPEHTLNISAGYSIKVKDKTVDADVTFAGVGPFNWDESGTRQEQFRIRTGGRIALVGSGWEIYVRGENLTNARGNAFYFKSVGNEFFAATKPRMIMTGITIKL